MKLIRNVVILTFSVWFILTIAGIVFRNYINIFLIVIGGVLAFLIKKKGIELNRKKIILSLIVLFFLELFIVYNAFFITGWDSGSAVIPTARAFLYHLDIDPAVSGYYSWAYNNFPVTYLYYRIFRMASIFGISYINNGDVFVIAFINIVINVLTIYLTYMASTNITDKNTSSLIFIFSYLIIGFCPWTIIAYTDSLTLFIPALTLYLYFRKWDNNYLKILFIVLIPCIGYLLKAQCIIVLIAIIVNELLTCQGIKDILKPASKILLCILMLFCLSKVENALINRSPIAYDPEQKGSIYHFLMMGANESTEGKYSEDDVAASTSIRNKKMREEYNRIIFTYRIKKMGLNGILRHYSTKNVNNYSSGVFAWGDEGNFYLSIPNPPFGKVSLFVRDIIYTTGNYYKAFEGFLNCLWFFIVFCLSGIYTSAKKNKKVMLLVVTIIGITLFETIFESRARYIYIYAPIIISAGCIGFNNMFKILIKQRV